MLGAVTGATYGLLYRAVDGFNGVVGSAGLWLYAESSNERDGGVDPTGLRARSLAVLPRFGLALAVIVVVGAGAVGELVPRLAAETDTLRILAAAFPLLTVNAVELHVRSGRGRNREVLTVNVVTLLVNVPLSIALISSFGLPGAAAALALSELLQASLLWCSASRDERILVGRALATAVAGAVVLLLTAAALSGGSPRARRRRRARGDRTRRRTAAPDASTRAGGVVNGRRGHPHLERRRAARRRGRLRARAGRGGSGRDRDRQRVDRRPQSSSTTSACGWCAATRTSASAGAGIGACERRARRSCASSTATLACIPDALARLVAPLRRRRHRRPHCTRLHRPRHPKRPPAGRRRCGGRCPGAEPDRRVRAHPGPGREDVLGRRLRHRRVPGVPARGLRRGRWPRRLRRVRSRGRRLLPPDPAARAGGSSRSPTAGCDHPPRRALQGARDRARAPPRGAVARHLWRHSAAPGRSAAGHERRLDVVIVAYGSRDTIGDVRRARARAMPGCRRRRGRRPRTRRLGRDRAAAPAPACCRRSDEPGVRRGTEPRRGDDDGPVRPAPQPGRRSRIPPASKPGSAPSTTTRASASSRASSPTGVPGSPSAARAASSGRCTWSGVRCSARRLLACASRARCRPTGRDGARRPRRPGARPARVRRVAGGDLRAGAPRRVRSASAGSTSRTSSTARTSTCAVGSGAPGGVCSRSRSAFAGHDGGASSSTHDRTRALVVARHHAVRCALVVDRRRGPWRSSPPLTECARLGVREPAVARRAWRALVAEPA